MPLFLMISLLLICVSVAGVSPGNAQVVVLDASVRQVHENNIDPRFTGPDRPLSGKETGDGVLAGSIITGDTLTSAMKRSDTYTVISGSGGAETEVGVETQLSLTAEASRYIYRRFTGLNATRIGIRMGLFKQVSDMHSVRIGVTGCRSSYGEPMLDSSAYEGNFDMQQQLSSKFWVGEGVSYGKNSAAASLFSYAERAAAAQAAYRAGELLTTRVVYSYRLRTWGAGGETGIHAVALAGSVTMPGWELFASVERIRARDKPPGKRSGNTIASMGMAYSF